MQEEMIQLTAAVEACAAIAAWPLSDGELDSLLDRIESAERTLRAAKLHVVREIDGRGLPARQQAASPTAWLRGRLQVSYGEAKRLLAHAAAIDANPALDAALTAGVINSEQLAAIVDSLDALPDDVGEQVRAEATTTLIGWAPHLDPVALRRAGQRILYHVAPEDAEAADEAALRRAEQAAQRQRHFTLVPLGDGRVRLHGLLPAEAAGIVSAALDPLCRPDSASTESAESGEARTPGQRRADALTDICRAALSGGTLPDNGGDRPQVAITVDFDVLRQKFGAGMSDNGEPVSAEAVRRMACDARILPIVLDGAGQVLDAGRSRRLVTGPLRRALVVRDRGCVFPGCDRPPRWTDGHHIRHWADGGATEIGNLALLCGHHHRVIHDPESGWQIRMGDDGHPELLPPAWLDPSRLPRRNVYHRRV